MKLSFSDAGEKLRRVPPFVRILGVLILPTVGVLFLLIASAWATRALWWPRTQRLLAGASQTKDDAPDSHGAITSIEIFEQAKRNIGLRVGRLEPTTFQRKIGIPAMVAERPGRTHIQVAAPMTGIITEIAVVRGESVLSGALLFRMRLSHEDLVRAQTDFLKSLGQLDAELKEIKRLRQFAGGAVAERLVIQRQYERDKLQAVLRAQEEALRLHGL